MKAVIFGAGKIARGFLGQLLFRGGYELNFVECNASYARLLDRAGRYWVNVMGNPAESEWINGYRCFDYDRVEEIADALVDADVVFTSVVGSNLPELGKFIAKLLSIRDYTCITKQRTIICCENWKNPSAELKEIILNSLPTAGKREDFLRLFGTTDAVVMRSAVEPTEEIKQIDPLAVSVHNFWELPVNSNGMKGNAPIFPGVRYLDNFNGFLQQKVYTFNGGNATIAYLGSLKGYKKLSDAANDPEIVEMLREVYSEINPAICSALKVTEENQTHFMEAAIRKYQDRAVEDFTERHARDPLRKIGPDDRITGVARMIEQQNIRPVHVARTLAAALLYTSSNTLDPSAAKLEELRTKFGIDYILQTICNIDPNEDLARLVHLGVQELKQRGWIHES